MKNFAKDLGLMTMAIWHSMKVYTRRLGISTLRIIAWAICVATLHGQSGWTFAYATMGNLLQKILSKIPLGHSTGVAAMSQR